MVAYADESVNGVGRSCILSWKKIVRWLNKSGTA